MEASEKVTIPTWVWAIPILFGLLGGIVSWTFLRKRENSGWLITLGLITSALSNMLFQVIY